MDLIIYKVRCIWATIGTEGWTCFGRIDLPIFRVLQADAALDRFLHFACLDTFKFNALALFFFCFDKPHFFAPFIIFTTRIILHTVLLYLSESGNMYPLIFALVCSNSITLSTAPLVLHIVVRTDWRIQKKWDGVWREESGEHNNHTCST